MEIVFKPFDVAQFSGSTTFTANVRVRVRVNVHDSNHAHFFL